MFNVLKSPGRHRDQDALPLDRGRSQSSRRHSRLVPRPVSMVFSRLFDPDKADSRPDTQLDKRPDPEVEQLENDIRVLRQAEEDAKERYNKLQGQLETMKEIMTARQDKREQLKQVTKELAVAQKFLSTADGLSQAEVVRAMEALNEEIFQLTSIVADKIQVEDKQVLSEKEQRNWRYSIPESAVGSEFLGIITERKLEDPLAIQIAWQAILVGWCSELIRAWYTETVKGSEGLNVDMDRLYKDIQSANEQAIAGRWRSLTFTVTDEPSSDTRERQIKNVATSLAAVSVICGYITNQEVYDDLVKAFLQRLGPLLDKTLKFRRMIAEGITSTDIKPYTIKSGDEYNSKRADLEYEDEKDNTLSKKQGIVACSLALGLLCSRMPQERDDKVGRITETILKSKVILQDTLIEVIS